MNHRFLVVVFLCAACAATHETDEPEWPGPQDDGTIALHNGWRLAPHGEQLRLDSDLPLRMAWHPGGRYLAIQHAGYRDHRIAVLDSRTDEVLLQLELPRTWSGFAWSGDGERVFVSGGVDDVVHVFAFDPHDASAMPVAPSATWPVGDPDALDLPAGMCLDGHGRLSVTLQRTNRLVRLDDAGETEVVRENANVACVPPQRRRRGPCLRLLPGAGGYVQDPDRLRCHGTWQATNPHLRCHDAPHGGLGCVSLGASGPGWASIPDPGSRLNLRR